MKKILSVFLLSIALLLCLNVTTFAAMPETVEPLWDNTAYATKNIVFNETNTMGTVAMRVTGKVGTTRVEGYGVVYERVGSDWVFVDDQSNAMNGMSCAIEIQFDAELGHEYKAEFTFVVYKNGVGETVESTIIKTCE